MPYLKNIQISAVSRTSPNLTATDFIEITMVFPRSARMGFLTEFQHCYFWLWIQEMRERDILKNITQCLKKLLCSCFGATNRHRERKGFTHTPVLSVHPGLLCLKIPTEHFSGKSCSSALGRIAILAYVGMRCVLRNLSVALLFWDGGTKTFLCSSGVCEADCAALQWMLQFASQPLCSHLQRIHFQMMPHLLSQLLKVTSVFVLTVNVHFVPLKP